MGGIFGSQHQSSASRFRPGMREIAEDCCTNVYFVDAVHARLATSTVGGGFVPGTGGLEKSFKKNVQFVDSQ